ncbi:MAG: ATP-binding protein [Christensenellales bacterium]|jgi:hypothetical protein
MKDLSLSVLDLTQNALSAGASLVEVTIEEDTVGDRLSLTVEDNGRGMDAELVSKVVSPFVTGRTTRKVGLGIPLFKEACEACEGEFSLTSAPGVGTRISGWYRLSHIDRPPMGDMAGTLQTLILMNPERNFVWKQTRDGREFSLDTRQIREIVGPDVPLDGPDMTAWFAQTIPEGVKSLYGGSTHEIY